MKKTLLILLAVSLYSFAAAQEWMILKNGPIAIERNHSGTSHRKNPPY